MSKLTPTPGQTVGPFYGYALPYPKDSELVVPGSPRSMRVHGTVTDGNGDPIPDCLLEIWQADEHGVISQKTGSLKRDGYTFTGWGRAAVDDDGHFTFTTVNPGSIEEKAPFIAVVVFARGLLNKLHTRVYLPEDTEALAKDALLNSLPADRRATLIAEREEDGSLLWNIRLQGENETVFLDFS